jgi:hypothetical protein
MSQKEYLVTQYATFTWKVTANTPEEAEHKASQLDYADAWESYADAVDINDIVEYKEEV